MCYSCLSILNEILSDEKIKKLKEYFIGLTPNNRDLITVSKIADALEVSNKTAVSIILKCEENGILQRHFGIRCPNCGMLIKEIPDASIEHVSINECYSCDEEICINEDDIVILFRLLKVEIPFECGQQSGQSISNEASIVAQEDTLKSFKILCESMTRSLEEKRIESYNDKLISEKREVIHKKAVIQANKNRIINVILNILCIGMALVVICGVYVKYGFAKLSLFTTFAAFILPFVCNYIIKEIFLTDVERIEEKLLAKKEI